MAHWAELDENNIVIRVTVDSDDALKHLTTVVGGRWVQTSYNTRAGVHELGGTPLRKNYAGIGYTYDEGRDAFVPPMPEGDGWVLNESTCLWEQSA